MSITDAGRSLSAIAKMCCNVQDGGMHWNFTDFCPLIFSDIRRLTGLEDAEYVFTCL